MDTWKLKLIQSVAGVLCAATLSAGTASAALDKGVTSCDNGACSWSLMVDGAERMSGMYSALADGTLFIDANMMQMTRVDLGDGGFISLDGIAGNIDPILGFSASAGTGTTGRTFAFNFSLPIALSGTVQANASVSYSLTSLSNAGAQITPLFGHTVIAQDVDTSVGGLPPINKGVDIGDMFFVVGGPTTANSPVYTASHGFPLTVAHDTMSATIAFALSPQSQVGMSGFVEQVAGLQVSAVPEPDTYGLFFAGLGLLGIAYRRRFT